MSNRLTAKERRRVILTSIFCFFIIGLSIISSINNITKISEKKRRKKSINKKIRRT